MKKTLGLFYPVLSVCLIIIFYSCRKHSAHSVSEQGAFSHLNYNANARIITAAGDTIQQGEGFPKYYVSLTYDDGPDKNTSALISYLSSQHVPATFFLVQDWSIWGYPSGGPYDQPLTGGYSNPNNSSGGNVVGNGNMDANQSCEANLVLNQTLTAFTPPTTQFYLDQGQLLGNHTKAHSMGSSDEDFLVAISLVQEYLDPYLTNKCYMFRAPYSAWPTAFNMTHVILAESTQPAVKKLASTRNYMDGNMMLNDWQDPNPNQPWPYYNDQPTSQSCHQYSPAYRVNYLLGTLLPANSYSGIIVGHDRNENAVGSTFALDMATSFIPAMKSQGYVFGAPVLKFSNNQNFSSGTNFSDADGWDADIGYYGTLRLVDVNNDGKADMCGRGIYGIYVALANGNGGFDPSALWKWDDWTDALGYKPAQYSTTLQFGDVDGDHYADAIIRGPNGIMVAHNNNGNGFAATVNWSSQTGGNYDFSDAAGWNNPIYYGSIRVADVNQDGYADIVARGIYGIYVATAKGNGLHQFNPQALWKWDDFTDATGYNYAKYSSTMQVADVTGDGYPDIVMRGPAGMMVARNNSGLSFGTTQAWSTGNDFYDIGDNTSWGSSSAYYGTIRLADINGDHIADVCARSAQGIVIAFGSPNLNGGHFLAKTIWNTGSLNSQSYYYTDAQGFNDPKYALTIQFGDINAVNYQAPSGRGDGRADIVIRSSGGLTGGYAP